MLIRKVHATGAFVKDDIAYENVTINVDDSDDNGYRAIFWNAEHAMDDGSLEVNGNQMVFSGSWSRIQANVRQFEV